MNDKAAPVPGSIRWICEESWNPESPSRYRGVHTMEARCKADDPIHRWPGSMLDVPAHEWDVDGVAEIANSDQTCVHPQPECIADLLLLARAYALGLVPVPGGAPGRMSAGELRRELQEESESVQDALYGCEQALVPDDPADPESGPAEAGRRLVEASLRLAELGRALQAVPDPSPSPSKERAP